MNKKIISIIGVVVVIIGGFILFSGEKTQTQNTTPGIAINDIADDSSLDPAPEFSLKDWDGNDVNLSDFKGRPVIVNSWAVWCPFCVDELPEFGKLQEEFGDDIVVIAIDRAESSDRQKIFTDRLGVTGKIIFLNDPRDSFYQSIGGFSMPETLFVNRDGNINFHKRGSMDLNEMRERANSIIN